MSNSPNSHSEVMPEASHDEEKPANIIMAAAQGAQTGVKLAVAVGAMVMAFVAAGAALFGVRPQVQAIVAADGTRVPRVIPGKVGQ